MSETPNWNDTCDRYVAFLDIMGFKDWVFRNDHSVVVKKMQSFLPSIKMIDQSAENILSGKVIYNGVVGTRTIRFSDSVILVSNDDSEGSAIDFIYSTMYVMKQAILNTIPMKGAIAYGKQTANFDQNLHLGRPLIDAFELQKEVYFYGIALHHTMEQHLKERKLLEFFNSIEWLFSWPTPLKSGNITHYTVNWSANIGKDDVSDQGVQDAVSGLYNTASGSVRKYLDHTDSFLKAAKDYFAKKSQNKT